MKRLNVLLVHNKGVSYFEECLTSGGLLFQEERRALYKYILEINNDFYVNQAYSLLDKGIITRCIANGEATYFLRGRKVDYSAKKLNSDEVFSELRDIKLSRFRFYNVRKLQRFFAQCDVDVISNFPLPGRVPQEEIGFRTNDKEILTRLRTLRH